MHNKFIREICISEIYIFEKRRKAKGPRGLTEIYILKYIPMQYCYT